MIYKNPKKFGISWTQKIFDFFGKKKKYDKPYKEEMNDWGLHAEYLVTLILTHQFH